MTNNNNHWLFGMAALAALFQSGILYAAIENRASILRDGKDIVLLTQPVDPRDLMRGDYVTLGYAVSSIAVSDVTGTPDQNNTEIYVAVKPGSDGDWQLSRASFQPFESLAPGEVLLKGRAHNAIMAQSDGRVSVDYGIERYYIPQGDGARIEDEQRQQNIQAVIAVSSAGVAQIKALNENGKALYQEPLY